MFTVRFRFRMPSYIKGGLGIYVYNISYRKWGMM